MTYTRLVELEREYHFVETEWLLETKDVEYKTWLDRKMSGLKKSIEDERSKLQWELRRYHKKP